MSGHKHFSADIYLTILAIDMFFLHTAILIIIVGISVTITVYIYVYNIIYICI